jgi:hypothetical protein
MKLPAIQIYESVAIKRRYILIIAFNFLSCLSGNPNKFHFYQCLPEKAEIPVLQKNSYTEYDATRIYGENKEPGDDMQLETSIVDEIPRTR